LSTATTTIDVPPFSREAIGERRGHRLGWIRRALVLADVCAFIIGFAGAQLYEVLSGGSKRGGSLPVYQEALLFLAALPWWIWLAKVHGLYRRLDERADRLGLDEFAKIFNVVATGTWILFVVAALTHSVHPDIYKLMTFALVTITALPLCRSVARARYRLSPSRIQKVLIVGADEVGALIAKKIANHPELHLQVVGHVDSIDPSTSSLPIVGSLDGISDLITELGVDRLIVGFGEYGHNDILNLVRSLHETDVQIDVVPRLFEVIDPDMLIHSVEGLALLSVPPLHLSGIATTLKRALDIALAATGMLIFAPVFITIAVLIRIDSKGPILFRQVRMGEGARPFHIYKFRSMVENAEALKPTLVSMNDHVDHDPRMFKIAGDPRVTRIGRVLRRYSLDETPQLLNVLRGEMSMVGPRPLIPEEHEFVETWARRRVRIKPGITGPWQVMGRSSIPFDEMVKLDYRYVMHWSLWRDVRLIARTVPVVLRGRHAV
jgi:exopolysaccharide biosynthesis polyprenyl glycosylphosphotransferase